MPEDIVAPRDTRMVFYACDGRGLIARLLLPSDRFDADSIAVVVRALSNPNLTCFHIAVRRRLLPWVWKHWDVTPPDDWPRRLASGDAAAEIAAMVAAAAR